MVLENITFITFSDGKNLIMRPKGDTKILLNFNINNNIYPIGVGLGTRSKVEKTSSGKFNLLPEETAKLSPPPVDERNKVILTLYEIKIQDKLFFQYLSNIYDNLVL